MKKLFLTSLLISPLAFIACSNSETKITIENLELWTGAKPTISSTSFPKIKTFESLKTALPFSITTKGFIRLFEKSEVKIDVEDAIVTDLILDTEDPVLRSIFLIIKKDEKKYKFHSKHLNQNQDFLFPPYQIPFEEQDPNKLSPFGIGTKDWTKANEIGFDSLLLASQLKMSYWHIDHEHATNDYIMEIPLRIMIYDEIDKNFIKENDERGSKTFWENSYYRDRVILYSEIYSFRYMFGTREQFVGNKSFGQIKLINLHSKYGNPDLPPIKQDDITFGFQFLNQDGTEIHRINNGNTGSLTLNWLLWKKPVLN